MAIRTHLRAAYLDFQGLVRGLDLGDKVARRVEDQRAARLLSIQLRNLVTQRREAALDVVTALPVELSCFACLEAYAFGGVPQERACMCVCECVRASACAVFSPIQLQHLTTQRRETALDVITALPVGLNRCVSVGAHVRLWELSCVCVRVCECALAGLTAPTNTHISKPTMRDTQSLRRALSGYVPAYKEKREANPFSCESNLRCTTDRVRSDSPHGQRT